MVDDPKEIILEHLRYLRSRVDSIENIVKNHDKRFDILERQLAGARGDMAAMQELYVDHRDSVRGLAERVERIERRLDLVETPREH